MRQLLLRLALILLLLLPTASRAEPPATPGKQPLISRVYRPKLLTAALADYSGGRDPIAEGKTPEQRRFLTEHFRVMREEQDAVKRAPSYLFVEPLKRCGIPFPEGATVVWMSTNPPLRVTHTAAGIREIEKFMGLNPRD